MIADVIPAPPLPAKLAPLFAPTELAPPPPAPLKFTTDVPPANPWFAVPAPPANDVPEFNSPAPPPEPPALPTAFRLHHHHHQ